MRDMQGHPYTWNAILYFISHFITQNPESMKAVHLAISTISVFLILKYAPFNKIIKVMLVFGYFFFYEYSIISRNYALGVLCIVIFCILYKNKYKNILPIAIVLFFMGQANAYSFIISIALFLSLVIEFILDRKYVAKNIRKIYIILAVLIVIGEILFIYWQLGPQLTLNRTDITAFSAFNRTTGEYIVSFVRLTKGIINVFIPIPQLSINFWDTDRLLTNFLSNYRFLYTFLLSAILLIIPLFVLKRRSIYLYVFGLVGILIIPVFIYRASIRHYGHLFLLFMACIWLSNINKSDKYLINFKGKANKIFKTTFLTIILIPSLIGSSVAFYYDWKYPFSNGKYVAEYIEKNYDKDEIVIVGYQDYATETVAGYLDKDIYYPNSKSFKKLVDWSNRFKEERTEAIFREADSFSRAYDTVLVIKYKEPFKESEIPIKYNFEKLDVEFNNSIVYTENYYLYLFDKDLYLEKNTTDCIYRMDYINFKKFWKYLDRCEFDIKDEKVWIKVSGEDPHFESNFPIEFKDNKPILIYVNIYSAVDGRFQIFFGRKGVNYSEADSYTFSLNGGKNNVFIKIPYSEDLERIRVDPVNSDNDCYIEVIEFYNSKY